MLNNLLRKLLYREKASSADYVAYLRKQGVSIGEDVCFYSPSHTHVDVTCPWLLTIGAHVRITHGVIILTHDYAWSVLKQLPESEGRILGAQSPVTIGNNVFIGMNAIITRGVTVGDNVIIGAGSVVTGDCEPGSVYAGNPARKIMTIGQYLEKREAAQFREARTMAWIYREKFGKMPPMDVFNEYFMLFCDADTAKQHPKFRAQMATGMNFEHSEHWMRQNQPMFDGYDAFLAACFQTELDIRKSRMWHRSGDKNENTIRRRCNGKFRTEQCE